MTPFDLPLSDAPALVDVDGGQRVSYRELRTRAQATSGLMGPERSLVFLLCRNDTFTVVTYVAALVGSHSVALIDSSRPVEEILALAERYRPAWLAGPQGCAVALEDKGVSVDAVHGYEDGELVRLEQERPVALHRDLRVLLGTSGSTGSSRYVRLSAQNLVSNATSIASYLGLTASERPMATLPFHYSFGLSVLNSHLLVGASVALTTRTLLQRTFWEAAADLECTSLAGVPYSFRVLERLGYRKMDLPSLLTMQQAGGALDTGLTRTYADHMRRKGGRFFVMYGQTEATARMAFVPPDRLQEKLGSAGIAIPGGRLWVEGGQAVGPHGEPGGEVVYEGPNVMMGYASGADDLAQGAAVAGGALHTGDIGYIDSDGFLFIVGRAKRAAKLYGARVNLDEIELMFREHGPAAVIGAEDLIVAYCTFGTDDSLRDLSRRVAGRLRVHHDAVRAYRVESIPLLGSGKTDYRTLERWAVE